MVSTDRVIEIIYHAGEYTDGDLSRLADVNWNSESQLIKQIIRDYKFREDDEIDFLKAVGIHLDQYIEIDCPPGWPRPGDLIGDVLKDTGLPLRQTSSRLFGNWRWEYHDIDRETWLNAKPIIKARLISLHQRGVIRYASW